MKEDNYLEQLNYVDMDLVDAAGEDRRCPPLDKKRWPKRILTRVAVAVITMIVVLVLILASKERMQENAASSCIGGIPEYSGAVLDIKEGSLNGSQQGEKETGAVEEMNADTVFYLGGIYTRYLGPDILGGSMVGEVIGELTEVPSDSVSKHAVGTAVYRWSGYDPWCGIAIRSAEGGNYYYQRWNEEELARLTMAEYLPEDSQVTAISIRKRGGTQVGLITDPQVIGELLGALRRDAKLSDTTAERSMNQERGRYMDLILTDGSTLQFMLYDDAAGYSLREFMLPDGFLDEVCSHEIYSVDERLGSVNYGGSLIAEWARPSVRKVEPWVDGQAVYTVGSVWLDGNRLCMGHGGCYGPLRDMSYTVLAEDAAGDLRREEMEIWYRTVSGDVAYLYFWYPYDSGKFYDDLDAKEDFTQYIQKQTILYEGPFVKLQVRDGVVWTLDEQGILRKENEKIADGVTCFILDGSGTLYGTKEGLYRMQESTGHVQLLAQGEIVALASGGMTVYYGTADGQVCRVWVDGTHWQNVCEMAVRELQYFCVSRSNGVDTGLLGYEDHLVLIDSADRAWHLSERGEAVLIAESVQTMQYLESYLMRVQYTDGTQENINLLYFNPQ